MEQQSTPSQMIESVSKFIERLKLSIDSKGRFANFINDFQNADFRQGLKDKAILYLNSDIELHPEIDKLAAIISQSNVFTLKKILVQYLVIRRKAQYDLVLRGYIQDVAKSTEMGFCDFELCKRIPDDEGSDSNFAPPFYDGQLGENVISVDEIKLHLRGTTTIEHQAENGYHFVCTNNPDGISGRYFGTGETPFDAFRWTGAIKNDSRIQMRGVDPRQPESNDYYVYYVEGDLAEIAESFIDENGRVNLKPGITWELPPEEDEGV